MAAKKHKKYRQKIKIIPEEAQQEIIKDFYRKVLMLQEDEKRKISRDLHDETGQIVIALGASLNIIERELKQGNAEKALTLINANRELIDEIASKMKSMALNLRPPALDILGLSAVLREYFSQCTTSSPVKIKFNENLKNAKINEDIEITLYRIVQEATYNIIKHSMATTVKVDLIFEEKRLKLIMEDDGKGFNVEEYNRQRDDTKLGLRGIKERVDILKGNFSIESAPDKGTKLTIVLPTESV